MCDGDCEDASSHWNQRDFADRGAEGLQQLLGKLERERVWLVDAVDAGSGLFREDAVVPQGDVRLWSSPFRHSHQSSSLLTESDEFSQHDEQPLCLKQKPEE